MKFTTLFRALLINTSLYIYYTKLYIYICNRIVMKCMSKKGSYLQTTLNGSPRKHKTPNLTKFMKLSGFVACIFLQNKILR